MEKLKQEIQVLEILIENMKEVVCGLENNNGEKAVISEYNKI